MYNLYNKKLIYNYVNGLDIEGNIADLENDYRFMLQVMEYSKDKRMYNLCSDEIKSNYEFVKSVIELFKNDIKFITEVANDYLMSSNRENICTKELIILMNNLTKEINKDEIGIYGLRAVAFKFDELSEIYSCLQISKKEKELPDLGMGFLFVKGEYSSSEIIMNYLATGFIEQIFYNNEQYKFEELMHILIKDIKTFDKNKINSFLIDYIKTKDIHLANYVSCHIELLNQVKKDIKNVEKNWDSYLDSLNKRRVMIIFDYVYKYEKEKLYFNGFSAYKILDKLIIDMHLEEIFKKNILNYEEYPIFEEVDGQKIDFEQINFTNDLTNLIKELFSKDVIEDYRNDYDIDKPKAKVLNTNFTKRNKI